MATDKNKRIRRILAVDGIDLSLMTGLMWRTLPPGRKSNAVPRICRDLGAKFYCSVYTLSSTDQSSALYGGNEVDGKSPNDSLVESTSLGLYIPKPQEEGFALPPKTISAAAAFAAEVGVEYPDAVLILSQPDEKYYVVALSDGSPTADFIDNSDKFDEIVRHAQIIYSDDAIRFPGGTNVSFDWLLEIAAAHEKTAKLSSPPNDPKFWINTGALGLVVFAILAGGYVLNIKREQKKLEAEAKARREADPGPKYAAALKIAKNKMFYTRESWLKTWESLGKLPMITNGWMRDTVVCEFNQGSGNCFSVWIRKGGTNEDLIKTFNESNFYETIDTTILTKPDGGSMNLQSTTSKFNLVLETDPEIFTNGQQNPRFQLVNLNDWLKRNTPTIQDYLTAGLSFQVGKPVLWPVAAGVPATYKPKSNGVQAISFSLSMKGAMVSDFLKSSPNDFTWNAIGMSFKHVVANGEDKTVNLVNVEVKFKGVGYVAFSN